jgi:hypothetical protein
MCRTIALFASFAQSVVSPGMRPSPAGERVLGDAARYAVRDKGAAICTRVHWQVVFEGGVMRSL